MLLQLIPSSLIQLKYTICATTEKKRSIREEKQIQH